jgi:hypothetical protein
LERLRDGDVTTSYRQASIWQRDREYQVSFVDEIAGTYHLKCFAHARTMTATILVLPREQTVAAVAQARSSSRRLASRIGTTCASS